jgi:hypothetical protein
MVKIITIFAFFHDPERNFLDKEFKGFAFLRTSLLLGPHFLDHTRYREIPIKINNVVQTGPKIQLGGLKDGLFKALYQELIDGVVKIAPTTPANSQIIMLNRNFAEL